MPSPQSKLGTVYLRLGSCLIRGVCVAQSWHRAVQPHCQQPALTLAQSLFQNMLENNDWARRKVSLAFSLAAEAMELLMYFPLCGVRQLGAALRPTLSLG